jgi:ABC-type phosphate transport system permease subunit
MHRIRRIAAAATLAGGLLALAAASPTLARPWPGSTFPSAPAQAPVQIHTIVTGGMPGWQITLIAAAAALLAATVAVLLDRARMGRKTRPTPA